jgi:hypothetical protein
MRQSEDALEKRASLFPAMKIKYVHKSMLHPSIQEKKNPMAVSREADRRNQKLS